jgi:hypothetical protein
MFGYPLNCVGDALRLGGPYVRAIASVVLNCGAKTPGINCMWFPRVAVVGLFVDKKMHARWCNGCSIVGILILTWAFADNFGLKRDYRSSFSVSMAYIGG